MKLNGEIRVRHKLYSVKAIRDLIHEELWINRTDIRFGRVSVDEARNSTSIMLSSIILDTDILQSVPIGVVDTQYGIVAMTYFTQQGEVVVLNEIRDKVPNCFVVTMFGYSFQIVHPIINTINDQSDLNREVEDVVGTLWNLLSDYFEKNAKEAQI